MTSPSGSVSSPNYPQPYHHNAECTWRLLVGRGSRLSLVLSDVDLEASRGCHFDAVELFDGLRPIRRRSLGKFCGGEEVSTRTLESRGHAVTIRCDIR